MMNKIPAWVDGTLTPVDKLEVHKLGLRHKAVSVFVLQDDALLIQQRAMGKYHTPGLWANTCCTHPDWEEASLSCATRRLNEELGINGLNPKFQNQIEYRADVGGGLTEHEVVDVFLAEADESLAITPNPDEVMNTRWVALEMLFSELREIADIFSPWLKIHFEEHANDIFGERVIGHA